MKKSRGLRGGGGTGHKNAVCDTVVDRGMRLSIPPTNSHTAQAQGQQAAAGIAVAVHSRQQRQAAQQRQAGKLLRDGKKAEKI